MNKKQIVARRAVAAGGACLTGLMLTACQASTTASNSAGTQPSATAGQGNLIGAPLTLPAAPSPGATASATAGTNTDTNGGTSNPVQSVNTPRPPTPNVVTACQGSQIQVSTGAGQSGLSNFDIVLIFKNTSTQSCKLTGYAGAAVDYIDGGVLNAQRRMTAYLGGDMADSTPQTVLLAPGSSASGLLNWNPGPSNVECLGTGGTAKLLVTTPGTSNTVTLENNIGGACANFIITPVVPGTNGEKSS